MAQMNISVPDGLKQWAEQRVAEGRYSSASDYMRDLVRRDQESEPNDVEWVKAMLAEGEASGFIDRDAKQVLRDIITEYPADRG